MKATQFLLLFLITINLSSYSQNIIEKDIFTVNYSESFEQPLWLEYDIICVDGEFKRGNRRFRTEKGVHTSNDADYKYNIWDKGHLAPAATFNCSEEMLDKTFSFLNCALQHEKLNQGPWKQLEKFERNLSKFYNVRVRIDLIFDDASIKLTSGATVASFFVKTIHFNNETIIVKFPNTDVSSKNWSEFIILKDN